MQNCANIFCLVDLAIMIGPFKETHDLQIMHALI